jgi:hypothetical protein
MKPLLLVLVASTLAPQQIELSRFVKKDAGGVLIQDPEAPVFLACRHSGC